MRAPYRNRFDPALDFEARKTVTVSGRTFEPGEAFDKSMVSARKLRQLFDKRTLVYRGEKPGAVMSPEETAGTRRGQHNKRAAETTAQRAKIAKAKADAARKAAAAKKAATAKAAKDAKPKGGKPRPKKRAPRETVTGAAAVRVARAAVRIPADWATMPWPKRLQLAAQLTDEKVKNGADAAKAIEAELAHRGTP